MGEVIYLAHRVPTRPETPHERIKRLVKGAAAKWTDEAVLRRARDAKLASRSHLGVAREGDFIPNLTTEQRVFVGEVARETLRKWRPAAKPKLKGGAS